MKPTKTPCVHCGAIHHYTPQNCQRCGKPWVLLLDAQSDFIVEELERHGKAEYIEQTPDEDVLVLLPPKPEKQPVDFGTIDAKPVKKLFPGSHECLPGQLDLFE